MVLADHAGPEHHEDLAWHAARSRGGEVLLFHALRRLDGFPYERTVRHAWKRARLGLAHERHVAAYAAELGELEALYSFIRQLDSGRMQSRERRLLDLLRERVDTGGSKESLDTWLIANAARLRFDPDTLRYRIGER